MAQPKTRDELSEAAFWEARAVGLEAEVNRLRAMAAAGEAAGFLAHELSNLFTPVAGYARAALDPAADDALKVKALQKSLAASERVGDVCQAVLSLGGSVDSVGGASELVEGVNDALLALGMEGWVREGAEVRVNVPRGTRVNAARCVVQQVVMNLVLNARRAMAGRRGVIEVSGGVVGGRAVLRVRDEGRGMSAELIARYSDIIMNNDVARGDRYVVDVQELARSGSINGVGLRGVRVKRGGLVAGRLPAQCSPIRIWDVGEVADELRGDRVHHGNRESTAKKAKKVHNEGGEGREDGSGGVGEAMKRGVPEGEVRTGPRSQIGLQQTPPPASLRQSDGLQHASSSGSDAPCSSEHGPVWGGEEGTASADACVPRSGHGLGLALCRGLIGRDGGRLVFTSEVGRWTEARVEWPVAEGGRVAA